MTYGGGRIGTYKLYNPVTNAVIISRYVKFDEKSAWIWDIKGKCIAQPSTIRCEDEASTSVGIDARPQRTSCRPQISVGQPARLQDCKITHDNVIDDKGNRMHCARFSIEEVVRDRWRVNDKGCRRWRSRYAFEKRSSGRS
ncbi:hypothetical protein Scep_021942 [Stephania cephalantha]|uniref:Retroviral polymerase SH3-like domain-containing protein n=1 Tax=Stephania cephalantha TaxID=152367 RepID=A0AAP0FCX9_9MAGN